MRTLFVIGCWMVSLLYVVSCFSWRIPPSTFEYSFVLALGFPFLLIAHIAVVIVMLFRSRKAALLLFLLTFIGWKNIRSTFATGANKPFAVQKDSTALRVMNWNVAYWASALNSSDSKKLRKRDSMVALIKKYNPDVLCLQEYAFIKNVRDINIKKTLRSLGYRYMYFPKSHTYKENQSYDGTIILSKLPFLETEFVETGGGFKEEPLLTCTVKQQGKIFKVATVHLLSYGLFSSTDLSKKQALKSAVKQNRGFIWKLKFINKLHENQVEIINRKLRGSSVPVILCGDFNETPVFYSVNRLKGNRTDAFSAKNAGLGATLKNFSPFLRIDYCFADPKLSVRQNTVVKKDLSDHYPLITDVAYP